MKCAIAIARRSRQSDRSEKRCAKPRRRHAWPARRRDSRLRLRVTRCGDDARHRRLLNASLEQMKIVEEMRRTLREFRDMNKLRSS